MRFAVVLPALVAFLGVLGASFIEPPAADSSALSAGIAPLPAPALRCEGTPDEEAAAAAFFAAHLPDGRPLWRALGIESDREPAVLVCAVDDAMTISVGIRSGATSSEESLRFCVEEQGLRACNEAARVFLLSFADSY